MPPEPRSPSSQSESAEYHAAHLAFVRANIVEAAANREPILDKLRAYAEDVARATVIADDQVREKAARYDRLISANPAERALQLLRKWRREARGRG